MLVKVKGLHFLNAPSFMDRLMMMIKPFMKKELLEVLLIHQIGAKTLDKFVPMSGLPKEAGGDFKSFDECRGNANPLQQFEDKLLLLFINLLTDTVTDSNLSYLKQDIHVNFS